MNDYKDARAYRRMQRRKILRDVRKRKRLRLVRKKEYFMSYKMFEGLVRRFQGVTFPNGSEFKMRASGGAPKFLLGADLTPTGDAWIRNNFVDESDELCADDWIHHCKKIQADAQMYDRLVKGEWKDDSV